MTVMNWIGLIALILGFSCFGLIGFKRSEWWGPAKGMMEPLGITDKRFAKIGFILVMVGFLIFVVANI